VSDSKLTSFQYESETLKLGMECGQVQTVIAGGVDISAQAANAMISQAGTVMPVTVQNVQNTQAEEAKEPEGNIVKSPLVGTFYAAPSEDAEPFVKVGDTITKGQVLAIVEAMKLMNDIESDFDGEIAEIYVKNGEAVDYGKPLFRVK
jgi:acetyl-CoA carboxylase biotin carboxyl carrier protein